MKWFFLVAVVFFSLSNSSLYKQIGDIIWNGVISGWLRGFPVISLPNIKKTANLSQLTRGQVL